MLKKIFQYSIPAVLVLLMNTSALALDQKQDKILGNWISTNEEIQICSDEYVFSESNNFMAQSGSKQIAGTFKFLPSKDNEKLDFLSMAVKTDNKLPDCMGENDYENEETTVYLKWISPKKAQFCADESGLECYNTLLEKK